MTMRGFEGRHPELADGAYVDPSALVVGWVRLGAGVSVWPYAVLRGDGDRIDVADGTNIQDGSVVHVDPGVPCTIGAHVTVGHRAIVHGCAIDDEVLIGMGAVVMNHARVGSGSIIGAGALVTEHTEIPPGVLAVGVPARVVRATTPAERTGIQESAARYLAMGARHRAGQGAD